MKPPRCLVIIFLGLLPGLFAGYRQTEKELLRRLIAPPNLARGEFDQMSRAVYQTLKKNPSTPLVDLAVARLNDALTIEPADKPLRRSLVMLARQKNIPAYHSLVYRVLAAQIHNPLVDSPGDDPLRRFHLFARHWFVSGPYGSDDTLIDEPFAPESGDLRKIKPWRYYSQKRDYAEVYPKRLTYPGKGIAYAVNQFYLPREAEASLILYASDSAQLFVNGHALLTIDRQRTYARRQRTVFVKLIKGWNTVMVKSGAYRFNLAIVSADYRPLLRKEKPELPLAPADKAAVFPGMTRKDPDTREFLKKTESDAMSLTALGILNRHQNHMPLAVSFLKKAAALSPRDPYVLYEYAVAVKKSAYLPADYKKKLVMQLLDRILTAAPDFIPALCIKADVLTGDDKMEEGIELLRPVLDKPAFKTNIMLLHKLCDISIKLGWDGEVSAVLAKLRQTHPARLSVRRRLRRYYKNRCRRLEKRELIRLMDENPTVDEFRRLMELEEADGALDKAERMHRRFEAAKSAFDNTDAAAALGWARFFERKGQMEKADACWRQYQSYQPFSTGARKSYGDFLARTGKHREAVAAYRSVLTLSFGDVDARRRLSALNAKPDPLMETLKNFMHADNGDPFTKVSRADASGASVACLRKRSAMRVLPDHSTITHIKEAQQVLTQEGVKTVSAVRVSAEHRELFTQNPDGIHEPTWLGPSRGYDMPAVSEGSIVRRYDVATTSAQPQGHFSKRIYFFADSGFSSPILKNDLLLIKDDAADFNIRLQNSNGVIRKETRREGATLYSFHARGMKRLKPERYMPPAEDVLPCVIMYKTPPPADILSGYRNRLYTQTRLTPELRATAAGIVKGVSGHLNRARQIYRFVDRHVQKDSRANALTTLLNRKGNRNYLFAALLKAADVPFEFGLASGDTDLIPKSQKRYADRGYYHSPVICLMPKTPSASWLAVRQKFPFGKVPMSLMNSDVILVDRKGWQTGRIPPLPRDEWLMRDIHIDLTLGAGTAGGVFTIRYPKPEFSYYKWYFENADGKAKDRALANILTSVLPGASIQTHRITNTGIDDGHLRITVHFTCHYLLSRAKTSNGVTSNDLRLPLPRLKLVKSFIAETRRQFPFAFYQRYHCREQVNIRTGPYAVNPLPGSVHLKTKMGEYTLKFQKTADGISLTRRVDIGPFTLPPNAYGTLIQFCDKIDAVEDERITLKQKPQ